MRMNEWKSFFLKFKIKSSKSNSHTVIDDLVWILNTRALGHHHRLSYELCSACVLTASIEVEYCLCHLYARFCHFKNGNEMAHKCCLTSKLNYLLLCREEKIGGAQLQRHKSTVIEKKWMEKEDEEKRAKDPHETLSHFNYIHTYLFVILSSCFCADRIFVRISAAIWSTSTVCETDFMNINVVIDV